MDLFLCENSRNKNTEFPLPSVRAWSNCQQLCNGDAMTRECCERIVVIFYHRTNCNEMLLRDRIRYSFGCLLCRQASLHVVQRLQDCKARRTQSSMLVGCVTWSVPRPATEARRGSGGYHAIRF